MSISTDTKLPAHLHPSADRLGRLIGSPARWAMLRELSCGEPRMVTELARVADCSVQAASKHLAALRAAGLVVLTRRNYQLPAHFIVSAEAGHLDFGHCLLRLKSTGQSPEGGMKNEK